MNKKTKNLSKLQSKSGFHYEYLDESGKVDVTVLERFKNRESLESLEKRKQKTAEQGLTFLS